MKFKQPIDERVKLPKIAGHILVFIFGIGGSMSINRPIYVEYDYIDSLVLLVSAIYGGLATFGAFNLLHDIKQHSTIKSFLKSIIDKFEITFYDDNKNDRNSN